MEKRGERAIYYFQGREQAKTRHKPNLPNPKGPQLWSHRRKADHYKDPRPGGGPWHLYLAYYAKPVISQSNTAVHGKRNWFATKMVERNVVLSSFRCG